jgi:hypothetical protein
VTDAGQSEDGSIRLAELSRKLDETAAKLRDDGVDEDEAKRLAASCADLAAEAAVELDRMARGGPLDPPPGQEELL